MESPSTGMPGREEEGSTLYCLWRLWLPQCRVTETATAQMKRPPKEVLQNHPDRGCAVPSKSFIVFL
jgi:hypothetical protein